MISVRRRVTGVAAVLAAYALGPGSFPGIRLRARAQGAPESHPAHIHSGTCAELGDVVFPLSNVGGDFPSDGTPMAGSAMGATSAIPVEASVTTVQASLADIVSGGHAINIHESAENIQNYIACGDIGGMMLGTSDLPIGLASLNQSGAHGVAWLHDNGDGTTTVSVFLTESGAGDAGGGMDHEMATPDSGGMNHEMGSPAAGGADGGVAVTIVDFAYDPAELEVAAGTTVTWTNNDSSAHTVSQTGGGFESGKLDNGMTFSFTFDTPGTYEYFCQFHPNMTASVVVA